MESSSTESTTAYELSENAKFAQQLNDLRSTYSTADLQEKAQELIAELEKDVKSDTYEVGDSSLQLHRILQAVLDYAEECNGEDALRYSAAAISACSGSKRTQKADAIPSLRELALTWVSNFLYPFISTTHWNRPRYPHVAITRLMRGFFYGRTGLNVLVSFPVHSVLSSPKTQSVDGFFLDMVREYYGLTEEMLSRLNDAVDHPMNGLMVWQPAYDGFNRLYWSLGPTEKKGKNTYKVKIFDYGHQIVRIHGGKPEDVIVKFKDCQLESPPQPNGKTPSCNSTKLSLPEPQFLRIHAAVAGILKSSGAGKFFDELLDVCEDYAGRMGVPTFEDVVRTVQAVKFKQEFQKALVQKQWS